MQLRFLLALIIAHGILADDDSSFLQLSDTSRDADSSEAKVLSPNERARRKRAREVAKSPAEKEVELRAKNAAVRAQDAAMAEIKKEQTGIGASRRELSNMYSKVNETVHSKIVEYAKLRRNLQFLEKSVEHLELKIDRKSRELEEHLDLVDQGMKKVTELDAKSNEVKLALHEAEADVDLADADNRKFNIQKREAEVENTGMILRAVTEETESQRAKLDEKETEVKQQVDADETVAAGIVSNQEKKAHIETVVSGMNRNSKVLTDLRSVLADELENTEAEWKDMNEKERVQAADKLTTLMRRAVSMQKTVLQKAYGEVIDATQQHVTQLVQEKSVLDSTMKKRTAELANDQALDTLDPVVDSVIRNLHLNQGLRKNLNERRTALEKRLMSQEDGQTVKVAGLEKNVEALEKERDRLEKLLPNKTQASLLQLESSTSWPFGRKKQAKEKKEPTARELRRTEERRARQERREERREEARQARQKRQEEMQKKLKRERAELKLARETEEAKKADAKKMEEEMIHQEYEQRAELNRSEAQLKLGRQEYVKLVAKKDQLEELMEASLKDEEDLLAQRADKENAVAAIELKIQESVALFSKLGSVADDGQAVIDRQEQELAAAKEKLKTLSQGQQKDMVLLRSDATAVEEARHLSETRHQLHSLQDEVKDKHQELQALVKQHLFETSAGYRDLIQDQALAESAAALSVSREAMRQVFDDSWQAVQDLDKELVQMRSLREKLVGNNAYASDDLVRDLADLKSMVNTEATNLDKLDQQVTTQKEDLEKAKAQLASLQQGASAGLVQASEKALDNAIFSGPVAATPIKNVELNQLPPTIKEADEQLQRLEADADQRDKFFAEQADQLNNKAKELQLEIDDLTIRVKHEEEKKRRLADPDDSQPTILREDDGSFLD